jgi:hypothetical protein
MFSTISNMNIAIILSGFCFTVGYSRYPDRATDLELALDSV